jgi:predicted nucleic acid-binding protein
LRPRRDATRDADRAAVRDRGSAALRRPRPARTGHAAPSDAPRAPGRRDGERARVGARGGAAGLILYFDTSALLKLLVAEDGSDLVAELWATELPGATSLLAHPEARAALAAARRAGRLTERAHRRAVSELEDVIAGLALIGVDEELARHAGALAGEFALRGYDAVHLASALAAGAAVTMVTWDEALRRAASAGGMALAPPA